MEPMGANALGLEEAAGAVREALLSQGTAGAPC